MRLLSDFTDFYDHWFDADGPVFRRVTTDGLGKRGQLALLQEVGYQVPPHGTVGDVLNSWWEDEDTWVKAVVAYENEFQHCGEGKRLLQRWQLRSNPHMGMSGGDRFWQERSLFCTAFVGDVVNPVSVSWRLLRVGVHRFWLEYRSTTDWRSNCGETSVSLIGVEKDVGPDKRIREPLFAIDFVIGKEMYAVDFNVAPGMRGTGVEKVLGAKGVVDGLRNWFDAV